MPKQIDPIERALDAYFQLDTDQRRTFHATVFHVEKERDRMLGKTGASPTPALTRGRPKGSKNRARASTVYPTAKDLESHELELRHNNGTATEGL